MHGPAASGDFVRPVTQMVDGESSRPTTDFFLTHSPRRLSYTRLLAKIEGKAAIAGRC